LRNARATTKVAVMDSLAKSKAAISINPKNAGKFTDYCKSLGLNSVTQECIDKGKTSKSGEVRKRAMAAENVKKFDK